MLHARIILPSIRIQSGESRIMIPIGAGGSRRFIAAVPVTPASATGGAAAPPIVDLNIDQDTAAMSHPPNEDATSGTTTTTNTRTPTCNVRRPPSAPPTTPMVSASHRLDHLRSASKSSTPESSLVANYTTPTTIATLSEVSKILPTVTSSRGNDDDESPSSETNNQQNHKSITKNCNGKVTDEDIIDSPTTNTSTSTSTSSTTATITTPTPTTIIGTTAIGTKEIPDKIKTGKDPGSSVESMDVDTTTTTEKMTDGQRATSQSALVAAPRPTTTKVDGNNHVENSRDASPPSTHEIGDSKADVKMIDMGATSPSANDIPSKVIDVIQHLSIEKKNNDDDDESSESKTNDGIHPTVTKCPSPSSRDDISKMKADDASLPTAKTEDTSNHSDRIFAFDPNNMDDVLNLGVNEFETIIIGPTPTEYIHDNLHGVHDHRSFGHEEYAYHSHHRPSEQEHYYPPMDSHHQQQCYSNPQQHLRYHPKHHLHYHQVGVVSPATTNTMAALPTNEVLDSFSVPVDPGNCTRYDPNPPGTRFQDESAYVDGIDKATGEGVAKSLPWSPIKMRKPKKTEHKLQRKLQTDKGITIVSVKVGGIEIFEKDDEPSCQHPHRHPPSLDDHPQPNIIIESQCQYHHPTDHQTVVSVLRPSPPNSPTPSVSSASMQEAVLKVREEFSNGCRYDSLGTSPFIYNINHDADSQVYGSTPAVPVPHTIAFGTSEGSRSASRRTSMSAFSMPASPDGEWIRFDLLIIHSCVYFYNRVTFRSSIVSHPLVDLFWI